MKRFSFLTVLSMMVATLMFTSCGPKTEVSTSVKSVTVAPATLTVAVGAEMKITATVDPAGTAVVWSSSDVAVATVVNGTVKGIKAGTATITAKAGDKTATSAVTVTATAVAVTGVTLNKATLSLPLGNAETLVATIAPADATGVTVVWTSSDATVATVAAGVITTIKEGTTTITATVGTFKAECALTVAPPVPAESVTIAPATLNVPNNKKGTLTATVLPATAADKTITWTSSDVAIATVADGIVTPVAESGSVTITATTTNGKVGTSVITITEKSLRGDGAILTSYCVPENAGYSYASTKGGTVGDAFELPEADLSVRNEFVNLTKGAKATIKGSGDKVVLNFFNQADQGTSGATDTYEVAVFVDWNNDGDFDDAGEMYRKDINPGAPSAVTPIEILLTNIPADATVVSTMRVMSNFKGTQQSNGCQIIESGNVFDVAYTIVD